jgi:hypothetical protein
LERLARAKNPSLLYRSISDTVSDTVNDTISDTVSDAISDKVSDTVIDIGSEAVSDTISDAVSDAVSDPVSDTVSDTVSNTVSSVMLSVTAGNNTVSVIGSDTVSDTVSDTIRDSGVGDKGKQFLKCQCLTYTCLRLASVTVGFIANFGAFALMIEIVSTKYRRHVGLFRDLWFLVSISPTFYEQLLRQNTFAKKLQTQIVCT